MSENKKTWRNILKGICIVSMIAMLAFVVYINVTDITPPVVIKCWAIISIVVYTISFSILTFTTRVKLYKPPRRNIPKEVTVITAVCVFTVLMSVVVFFTTGSTSDIMPTFIVVLVIWIVLMLVIHK